MPGSRTPPWQTTRLLGWSPHADRWQGSPLLLPLVLAVPTGVTLRDQRSHSDCWFLSPIFQGRKYIDSKFGSILQPAMLADPGVGPFQRCFVFSANLVWNSVLRCFAMTCTKQQRTICSAKLQILQEIRHITRCYWRKRKNEWFSNDTQQVVVFNLEGVWCGYVFCPLHYWGNFPTLQAVDGSLFVGV